MPKFTANTIDEALVGLAAAVGSALGYVEEQAVALTEALNEKNPARADVIEEYYREVRKISGETVARAMETVLRFKPDPENMRFIMASWRISADLEKAALYNREIAVSVQSVKIDLFPGVETGIKNLCDILIRQTTDVILLYTGEDDKIRTESALKETENLNSVYSGLFRQVLTHLQENPKLISEARFILDIAKNFCNIGLCMREIIFNLRYKRKTS